MQFRLNPVDPLFARAFPEIPPGNHGDQLPKSILVCLRIGACLCRLVTDEPYSSLETNFQISKTVLLTFFTKFLKWFLKEYYTTYVGELSGVGFDTKSEIEVNGRLFRVLGLSGFITVMDTVHMSYDRVPFPVRYLFISKEGYSTVGVNMHSTALGWVKNFIFPYAHDDKTSVRFDKLVMVMCHDSLFTSYEWDTSVTSSPGGTYKLCDCMTLCDRGYHRWKE